MDPGYKEWPKESRKGEETGRIAMMVFCIYEAMLQGCREDGGSTIGPLKGEF